MQKVFWYHYNKPASSVAGKPQVTIHYNKKCILVDNLVCGVPTYGHIKKDQPKFVIKGKCKFIKVVDGVAHIE